MVMVLSLLSFTQELFPSNEPDCFVLMEIYREGTVRDRVPLP
jgi:hypothetical protein